MQPQHRYKCSFTRSNSVLAKSWLLEVTCLLLLGATMPKFSMFSYQKQRFPTLPDITFKIIDISYMFKNLADKRLLNGMFNEASWGAHQTFYQLSKTYTANEITTLPCFLFFIVKNNLISFNTISEKHNRTF